MGKKQVVNYKKLELMSVKAPESTLQGVQDLMIFDARCLDQKTRHELLRLLPELTLIRNAWRAHFSVHGCVSCHRKKTIYGGGGFCCNCQTRIATRMRICFRKMTAGRDITE